MYSEKLNFDDLLNEYRSIWNHRLLVSEDKSSEAILLEAIKRELLDENAHPRIRKSKFEKFYSATRRVNDSAITSDAKLLLIKLHITIMEQLNQE